eukprot:INCI3710.1.p1 GENE.INCI3710.1~~INCI3710.1.p1  ORF type:complete len:937 (-),score=132.50 INCI3710.1:75-2885(-)
MNPAKAGVPAVAQQQSPPQPSLAWSFNEAHVLHTKIRDAQRTATISTTHTAAGLSVVDFQQVVLGVCLQILDFDAIAEAMGTGRSPALLRSIYAQHQILLHSVHCTPETLCSFLNHHFPGTHLTVGPTAQANSPFASNVGGTAVANWVQWPVWSSSGEVQPQRPDTASATQDIATTGSSVHKAVQQPERTRRKRKTPVRKVHDAVLENSPSLAQQQGHSIEHAIGSVDSQDAASPQKRARLDFLQAMRYQPLHRFCCYEWFYAAIDYRGFFAQNLFQELLNSLGIGDIATTLTRYEWRVIRQRMQKSASKLNSGSSVNSASAVNGMSRKWPFPAGQPRFGPGFVALERSRLEACRTAARAAQFLHLRGDLQEQVKPLRVAFEVPASIQVGKRVTAVHPEHFCLATGTVLVGLHVPSAEDQEHPLRQVNSGGQTDGNNASSLLRSKGGQEHAHGPAASAGAADPLQKLPASQQHVTSESTPAYCIQFETVDLGVHLVPDFLVAPHGSCEIVSTVEHCGMDPKLGSDRKSERAGVTLKSNVPSVIAERVTYQDAETQKHASRLSAAASGADNREAPEKILARPFVDEGPRSSSNGRSTSTGGSLADDNIPHSRESSVASAANAASAAAEALYRGGSRGQTLNKRSFNSLLALAAAAGAPGSILSDGFAATVLHTPNLMYESEDVDLVFRLRTLLERKKLLVEELEYLNQRTLREREQTSEARRASYAWVLVHLKHTNRSLVPVVEQFGRRFRAKNMADTARHPESEAWRAAFVRMCREPSMAIVDHVQSQAGDTPRPSEQHDETCEGNYSKEQVASAHSSSNVSSSSSSAAVGLPSSAAVRPGWSLHPSFSAKGNAPMSVRLPVPSRRELLVACVQLLVALRQCNNAADCHFNAEEMIIGLGSVLEGLVPRCSSNAIAFGKIAQDLEALKTLLVIHSE